MKQKITQDEHDRIKKMESSIYYPYIIKLQPIVALIIWCSLISFFICCIICIIADKRNLLPLIFCIPCVLSWLALGCKNR